IPTHAHAPLLRHAVESVRAQTVRDWELLIVGDGVEDETRAVVRGFRDDARIRFFDHPKGPRLGEAYRHPILQREAHGRIVCYLADDDLMLPRHLESMARLLENADFAHPLPLAILPSGAVYVWTVDLT